MTRRQAQGKVGDRLRSLACRICSADTIERIVDPLIADLQFEHAKAMRSGLTWRARRVRLAGYLAFWRTVGLCAGRAADACAAADQHAIGRTIGFALAATVAIAALFVLIPFSKLTAPPETNSVVLLAYLVPQAVSVAIPFGLPLGMAIALRGRLANKHLFWSIVGLAVGCTIVNFVVCGWVVPAANQEFRMRVSGRPYLAKGANELTFGELLARLRTLTGPNASRDSLQWMASYHGRLVLSCAPVVMALFALAVPRLARSRPALSIIVVAFSSIAYLGAAFVIRPATVGWPSFWAAIWFPNILFAGLAAILFICTDGLAPRRRSRP